MLAQTVIWKIIALTVFLVNGQEIKEQNLHPLTFESEADCRSYSESDEFKADLKQFIETETEQHGGGAKVTWSCAEGRVLPHPGQDI